MADVGVRLVPDEAAIRRLLSGPGGAVSRKLARKALSVEATAKRIATEEGLVDTGRYRSSISTRLGVDGAGLFAEVGSNVEYAGFIERGTRPHEIRARRKRALAWAGARHPVVRVSHPGTRAYHVLRRALRRAP